jgi:hypothetical protein
MAALVRRDLETRCDQRVLAVIGREEGWNYVSTLLHFASFDTSNSLRAAMGMAGGSKPMERRIRNMFRRKCADRLTRTISLVCAALVLCAGALTACQPTPTKPAVINKNDGKLEAAIKATASPPPTPSLPLDSAQSVALPTPTPIPTPTPHIKEQFKGADENVTITVDADVLKPDLPIPVIQVQPKAITMDMVKQAAHVLFEGNRVYGPARHDQGVHSRADIENPGPYQQLG